MHIKDSNKLVCLKARLPDALKAAAYLLWDADWLFTCLKAATKWVIAFSSVVQIEFTS